VELQETALPWNQLLDCNIELMKCDRFIGFRKLVQLQERTNLDIVPDAIGRILRDLETGKFDYKETTDTTCAIFDPVLNVVPEEFLERNVKEVRPIIYENICCIAADRKMGEREAMAICFASAPLSGGEEDVVLAGKLSLAEKGAAVLEATIEDVAERVPLLANTDDLVRTSTSIIVGLGESEICKHISRVASKDIKRAVVQQFCLHPNFMNSLHRSGIIRDDVGLQSLFRAMAEVVTDVAKELGSADLRVIRSKPTWIRDGADSRRMSLTMGGIGWRLHFWSIPPLDGGSRSVEFEGLRRHNDPVTIED
jgi:hypothetical protein